MANCRLVPCAFCLANYDHMIPATVVAPRYTETRPSLAVTWVPVCKTHFEEWYGDLPLEGRLPSFPLQQESEEKP